MTATLVRPLPKQAEHLKMNLKKQQLQDEHFQQVSEGRVGREHGR